MACGAPAALQRGPEDGITDVVLDVERRAEFLGLLGLQPFVVDAVAAVGVDVALEYLDVVHRVREHHHPARRVHHVVIQDLGKVPPHLHGMIVEGRALVEEIVRADDGGVAAGVAAADPALFEHGDVGHPVLLGEVIGGPQAMSAAADDHGVIARLGSGLAPLRFPAEMARETPLDQGPSGKGLAAHDFRRPTSSPCSRDHKANRPIPSRACAPRESRSGARFPPWRTPASHIRARGFSSEHGRSIPRSRVPRAVP